MSDRRVNLVFQGGGVRGIAYAGVLDSMPDHCKIHSVGGTSAGAIVAALLAIGTKPREVKAKLEDPKLRELLVATDVARTTRLRATVEALGGVLQSGLGGWRAPFRLLAMLCQHRGAWDDVSEIWSRYGLHSSCLVRKWLDETFGNTRFDQLAVTDLKIVAANVSTRRYMIYDKSWGRKKIAEAVHASVSIPIFFEPYFEGARNAADFLVDGGLVSNFPHYLFAQAEYPTIGFRLRDIEPGPITDAGGYLKGLLLTMTEAHDEHRPTPLHFQCYEIHTPDTIPSTHFDLSDHDIEALYKAGRTTGDQVEWDKHSSPTPLAYFYDPDPQAALQFSVDQARILYESLFEKSNWVDKIEQRAYFTVRIDHNWSVHYDRVLEQQVIGTRPLSLGRLVVQGFPGTVGCQSITAIKYVIEEVTGNVSKSLIRIPAFNSGDQKGFVFFYNPPLQAGQGWRRFHYAFSIVKEFTSTVAAGQVGHLSFTTNQVAHDHQWDLRMRFLVDERLPPLKLSAMIPGCAVTPCPDEAVDGRLHRVWECSVGSMQITQTMKWEIDVSLA